MNLRRNYVRLVGTIRNASSVSGGRCACSVSLNLATVEVFVGRKSEATTILQSGIGREVVVTGKLHAHRFSGAVSIGLIADKIVFIEPATDAAPTSDLTPLRPRSYSVPEQEGQA
jgi:hypothetical protein